MKPKRIPNLVTRSICAEDVFWEKHDQVWRAAGFNNRSEYVRSCCEYAAASIKIIPPKETQK
jgi:hypothetical protein